MPSLRRHRRWVSGWLVAFLLFMQWATAAYACPRDGAATPQGEAVAMAAMPGCDGGTPAMDPEQPQLCKAHCTADGQSVNSSAHVLDAPPSIAPGGALAGVLAPRAAAQRATLMPSSRGEGPPLGAPPLYLSLLVLRN
jgi:hypothetical protein